MIFEERILLHELLLNDTDDTIIDYIRSHRGDIQKMSIQKVAAELYVAPNAVMRLSKKLGYSGFAELKFSIQNENQPAKDGKTISSQLLEQLPNNIVKTLDIIDHGAIKRVISMMHHANCCIFAGVGDSTYFCEMLGKNLRCLERSVQYYQQIHDMFYAVNHGNKEDLLIVISARGEHERMVQLARRAGEVGMPVVSITHFCDNSLVKLADINLYFWGEDREVGDYNVTDRSGLMVLVRLLSEEYWNQYIK